ncbi:hypothetical protein TREMEDRAFT_30508 [Tremella mesenterica DSM 1558]|uniref:uncharacterized protein n=1 Tax=Tremella mesenterica (strain ATCC 24925 / CBS 8224 / DSM 1558 / NBRC 9311 / NRRL Y-6157 / RJB 2259-6 / UBC 559-6) TaxID=578456 RepID=UPI0003F48ECB|nr:uncharacterized protein TREMEDRAFT_30508 [Tremella mesenterica DSM 1558]EIW69314.1 hypothetical protein TREMEDRAFT_30508 [Tremella mesenterica DSM 1558]
MSSPPTRPDLIHNAVLFLSDPKVIPSSHESKVEFLRSKGLTDLEIEQSFGRASNSPPPPPPPAPPRTFGSYEPYGFDMRPVQPRRDWRDMFIMAVISGGVVYGLTALARKYLLPHLQPPSSTSFQTTSSSLSDQYSSVQSALEELSTRTSDLQISLDEDRSRVNSVIGQAEDAVKAVQEGEKRWRDDLREMRGEVDGIRELVPKMIEKHSVTQSAALADLQSELRSLRSLLSSKFDQHKELNGMSNSSISTGANVLLGSKGIPAWQRSGNGSPVPPIDGFVVDDTSDRKEIGDSTQGD